MSSWSSASVRHRVGTPQSGVFAVGTSSHRHLEFDLRADVPEDVLVEVLLPFAQPSSMAGGANLVIGFGPDVWSRLSSEGLPHGLRSFAVGDLPATQHDVWIWLHGNDDDQLFDTVRHVVGLLSPIATLASEIHGFTYRGGRDLTGFVDGTENPSIEEAYGVTLIPWRDRGTAGTCAFVQRWVHDLDAFERLSRAEQEDVIGRTKAESIELDDSVRPPTSHISRVVIEDDDGEELQIYRRSVPYGNSAEHGLLFVAFAADPRRVELMLERMFAMTDDGLHDRITEFSRPVSGSNYFVPSVEALAEAFPSG